MSFKEIRGQEAAIKILQDIMAKKRIASAYLFWGPEGVGKKMAALALARTLNCEKKGLDACGRCPSCQAIAAGNYGDITLLEPGGLGLRHHIDTIREIQAFINLVSFYGNWKVVIMDEAHRMTEEAAASLLKIMEEPPLKTIFILVSSRPENIVKTILSRCQPIRFLPRPLSPLTPEREAWRREILGWRRQPPQDIFLISQRIEDMARAEGRRQTLIMDTLHLFFSWYRDLLFLKEDLGDILNKDYAQDLKDEAGKISMAAIYRSLEAINEAQRDIIYQTNSRLVLDTLLLTLKSNNEVA